MKEIGTEASLHNLSFEVFIGSSNTPMDLYFIQGLNTTATHGHSAFMGVYGNLGIGLMLVCPLSGNHAW